MLQENRFGPDDEVKAVTDTYFESKEKLFWQKDAITKDAVKTGDKKVNEICQKSDDIRNDTGGDKPVL